MNSVNDTAEKSVELNKNKVFFSGLMFGIAIGIGLQMVIQRVFQ